MENGTLRYSQWGLHQCARRSLIKYGASWWGYKPIQGFKKIKQKAKTIQTKDAWVDQRQGTYSQIMSPTLTSYNLKSRRDFVIAQLIEEIMQSLVLGILGQKHSTIEEGSNRSYGDYNY